MNVLYYVGVVPLWCSCGIGVMDTLLAEEAPPVSITATLLAAASGAFALIFWIVRAQFKANAEMTVALRENTKVMQQMVDVCPLKKELKS